MGIQAALSKVVLGQEENLARIEAVIEANRQELGRAPLASFLLLGNVGGGKTHLARAIPAGLDAADPPFDVRWNIAHPFVGIHERADLLGSPAGGGRLVELLRSRPRGCVLVFDELEDLLEAPEWREEMLAVLEGMLTFGEVVSEFDGTSHSLAGSVVVCVTDYCGEHLVEEQEAGRLDRAAILDALHSDGHGFPMGFLERFDAFVVLQELPFDAHVQAAERWIRAWFETRGFDLADDGLKLSDLEAIVRATPDNPRHRRVLGSTNRGESAGSRTCWEVMADLKRRRAAGCEDKDIVLSLGADGNLHRVERSAQERLERLLRDDALE